MAMTGLLLASCSREMGTQPNQIIVHNERLADRHRYTEYVLPAVTMPEDVKAARVAAIMEAQQKVAFAFAAAQVGRELPVVIDGPDPEFAGHARGRTTADSPDIDCAVRVKGKNLRPGDFAKVKVTAADGYDLVGRAIGQPW